MINYADYYFYIEEYQGNLSFDLFNSLIPKASRQIDKAVNREIKEEDLEKYPRIKFVACELIDFINGNNNNNINYSSISIDGVSKTLKSNNEYEYGMSKLLSGLPQELMRCL